VELIFTLILIKKLECNEKGLKIKSELDNLKKISEEDYIKLQEIRKEKIKENKLNELKRKEKKRKYKCYKKNGNE